GPTNSNWLHYLSGNRMIDGQQVVDAHAVPIRYDVRCNREFYDYIAANPSKHPLYNIEGQEAARRDPKFQFEFPRNATEVKAAWKLLEKGDDDSRFWTAYGAYYDDDGKLQYSKIALTAFHIIRRDQFGWIFTTFEQVDNPQTTYTYFLQEKQEAVGENSTLNPEAAKYNALLEKRFQGTKWQHYRVMGWQTEETDADGRPVLLANTNIETYFPKTSSCKSCHAMANIGPNSNRRLNMWDMSKGIEGRVGNVDFQKIAKELAPGEQFKQTDYAWVLREAQSIHTSGPKAK
ncbi:MAG: hypothetical protein NT069_25975, partial [Planctomycetota bacterium]|nr:hypothetical protein [Planctomycetota bacterium]